MPSVITKFMTAYGHVLFRYRNIIFPGVLVLLILLFAPKHSGSNARIELWQDMAGILIILMGQALRAAVIGLAYIKRGGVNKQIYADHLVTTGIFAHCRNPLYTGNLLILCGLLVVYNHSMVYLLGGSFFLFSYICIVTAEEIYLGQKFGEQYQRYCNSVNRWIPSMHGLTTTLKSMQFDWRRVLYKDYTTMLTWLMTLLTLLTYERIYNYGFQQSTEYLSMIGPIALIVLIMGMLIRISKKNGRLDRKPLF